MSVYFLVNKETKIIENSIELEEGNFTSTFIRNDRGDKLPTFKDKESGELLVSTSKYLVPENYDLKPATEQQIGEEYGNFTEAFKSSN